MCQREVLLAVCGCLDNNHDTCVNWPVQVMEAIHCTRMRLHANLFSPVLHALYDTPAASKQNSLLNNALL